MSEKYKIKVTLKSETIFGSGNSLGSLVNEEVLHDEDGFPYYNAKTLKGKIRREAENIWKNIGTKRLEESYINLFGSEFNVGDQHKNGGVKFSDLTLKENVKNNLKFLKNEKIINKNEILNSMTNIRQFIKIENDTAVDGALRSMRTVKENLEFESEIECDFEKGSLEEALLFCSIGNLKYLGMNNAKGRGLVECELGQIGKDQKSEELEAKKCISEVLKK